MKTEMAGSVRMAGDVGRGVEVHIHLEEETLTLVADGGGELGTWPLDDVGVSSKPDGFHLRLEGEEVVLRTEDDAHFALALGIAAPTNRLARQMAILRDEAAPDLVLDLSAGFPSPLPEMPLDDAPATPRRAYRLADGLPYLGPLVVVAATVAMVASIVAFASGSAITFPGGIPAWPAMTAATLVMAAGGFAAFQDPTQGRLSIAGSIALGLLTILFSAGRLQDVGLAGEAMIGFTIAIVASGVLLAVDTAGRNTLDD
ncbi:MAG TPA: hypothetical protein VJ938_01665 [Acidimicrobiia bacterium]|nr:hypothetical protein [Acidimicrobiia bacterium]